MPRSVKRRMIPAMRMSRVMNDDSFFRAFAAPGKEPLAPR